MSTRVSTAVDDGTVLTMPHPRLPRRLLPVSGLLAALFVTAPALAASPTLPPSRPDVAQEAWLLDLTNRDRAQNGLPAVEFDPALLAVARARAAAQLTDAPLNHYEASGQLAFVDLLQHAGVAYTLAGENLARSKGSDATTEDIEHALMLSPTHRDNILEPAFDHMAVGMAATADGRVAFAEIFRATPTAGATQWVWFPTASSDAPSVPLAPAVSAGPALDSPTDAAPSLEQAA